MNFESYLGSEPTARPQSSPGQRPTAIKLRAQASSTSARSQSLIGNALVFESLIRKTLPHRGALSLHSWLSSKQCNKQVDDLSAIHAFRIGDSQTLAFPIRDWERAHSCCHPCRGDHVFYQDPVVSLDPRSTTGYRLISLRDISESAKPPRAFGAERTASHTVIALSPPTAYSFRR